MGYEVGLPAIAAPSLFLLEIRDSFGYRCPRARRRASQPSGNQARNLAQNNYPQYIQELWNIKRNFALSEFEVIEIEIALWSYGICYIRRQKNKRSQSLPFRFQVMPNPSRRC